MTDIVASPLTLILEHVEQGVALDRALFVSYTFDAGYFEQVALAPLEATGARIAVVADASQVELDPYAARRIGRRYAAGLVHHHSAFHPKLVVLQGQSRTTVGVGSANLTMAGWHSSEELWTVVTGTEERWPALLTEVGTWLHGLSAQSVLGERSGSFIRSLGEALSRTPTETAGPRLVTNLTESILEQLPAGPVEELNLYAPFHDVGAKAVTELVMRMQPATLRIAFQPELTSLDAPALERLVTDRTLPTEIRRLPNDRYRHGKLVEWRTPDGWRSLSGSPNLSKVALGRSMDAGNFEVGVLSSNPGPLLPDGVLVDPGTSLLSEVASPGKGGRSSRGLQILEASLEGDVVLLVLTEAAPEGASIQAVPAGYPPDQWETWSDVPVGVTSVEVPALAGGSWVHVRCASGEHSSAVPILVPTVFQRRLSRLSGAARPPEIDELFDDPGMADRFFQQLAALKDEIRGAAPITVSSAPGAGSQFSSGTESLGWEEYLDRLSGRLGEGLLRFALGIPSGVGGHGHGSIIDWDEEVSENEVGLDEDDAETVEDAQRIWTTRVPEVHSWSEEARERAIRFLAGLPTAPACSDPAVRLLALRMTLTFLAGGAWRRGDRSWIGVVLRHLHEIASNPAEAQQLRSRQGALAALSLSVLRSRVPRMPETVESHQIDRMSHELESLLDELDGDSLAVFCEDLEEALGASAHPDRVFEVALEAAANDQLDDAINALADVGSGVAAERRNEVLLLPDGDGASVGLGFVAIRLLSEGDRGVVQVGVGRDALVVIVWVRPRLVILRPMAIGKWSADVHALPKTVSPGDFSSIEELPRSSPFVFEGTAEWSRVAEMVAEAGVDAADLPPISEQPADMAGGAPFIDDTTDP